MTELKPCPCGNRIQVEIISGYGLEGDLVLIKCNRCGNWSNIHDTKEGATNAWNKVVGQVDNARVAKSKAKRTMTLWKSDQPIVV